MIIETLIPTVFEDSYQQMISFGKEYLKDKKVVYSILCRNIGENLENNINLLKKILLDAEVKSYAFVIYENDSTDSTKEVLESLRKSDDNIHYTSVDLGRKQFGPVKDQERITALAEYRNHNLEYIAEHFPDYDFVIVSDIDFVDISIDGVYHSFGLLDKYGAISAIAGNSYTLYENKLWNYDSWAYRGFWYQDIDTVKIENGIGPNAMYWFGMRIMPIGFYPETVNSAFGGMCIYRTPAYLCGVRYGDEDCEHVVFNLSLKRQFPNYEMIINPSQIMMLPTT